MTRPRCFYKSGNEQGIVRAALEDLLFMRMTFPEGTQLGYTAEIIRVRHVVIYLRQQAHRLSPAGLQLFGSTPVP
jgi:hypothetical protein